METWEWAWLAGIFEGEGSITFTGKVGARVSVGMTDQDVIESFNLLFPAHNVYRSERKNRIKPLYIWRIDNRDGVKAFLEGVLPYLHERRGAKARAVLARLEKNLGAKGKRTHCIRGHPLFGDNLYLTTAGVRQCIACRRARDRARGPQRIAKSECTCKRCGTTFFARRGTEWCSFFCRRADWRDLRRSQGLPIN